MTPSQNPESNPDATDASWDVLAAHMETFLEAWESDGQPPRLADHLPASDERLRRMVLIELIKIDLEYRRLNDATMLAIENYAIDHPELAAPDGMPTDLIFEEYHLRQSAGEETDPNDYLQRFPHQADALARLFAINTPTESSSLTGTRVLETFRPGDHIDDFYLMTELGTGAFGSVYLARQESMQRLVALKISGDKGSEGQTLAQLDHPHIVRVYDQCRLESRNLRLLYMQFAAGGTLQSVISLAAEATAKSSDILRQSIADALNRTGVLSPSDTALKSELTDKSWSEVTCRLGMELASALHYAHSHDILHRDVKPANVLLDANGSAKLADFNISFSSQLGSSGAAAYFGGSLAYMSPEQLEACHPGHPRRPDELDGRSDVYALGVVLWELLHGERPFRDEDVSGNWSESLQRMITLRRRGPDESPLHGPQDDAGRLLLRILRKCLAPDPDDRYETAEVLAEDLSLCLEPRVARILQKQQAGIPKLAARWPLLAIAMATMLPNGLAGVFNYIYNEKAIIEKLEATGEEAKQTFEVIQRSVNGVAYPIGLAGAVIFAWPVVRNLRRVRKPAEPSDEGSSIGDTMSALPRPPTTWESVRRRALFLGTFAAGLGVVEWFIAGFIYPIVLHMYLGNVGATEYVHFVGSMLICGMIAGAYPFFLLLLLAVRSFLPPLLQGSTLTSADADSLSTVAGQMGWFLYLAGAVPAVGTLLLLATGQRNDAEGFALIVLSAVGAIGFALAFGIYRTLHDDIAALQEATRLIARSSPNSR